jgi:hypothetical protein
MKHYGHTINTSSAQAAHVKSEHNAIIDSWYAGTTPSNVPYEIGIADDQIMIFAETAQDSYYAFVHVQSIVDAHDPFDLLWKKLKASIVDARTNGSDKVLAKIDYTDVQVKPFDAELMQVTLIRADALMRVRMTNDEAVKVAAQILAKVDTNKINQE